MKVRILIPTVCTGLGVEGEGGDVVKVSEEMGASLLAAGAVEVVPEPKPKTTKAK